MHRPQLCSLLATGILAACGSSNATDAAADTRDAIADVAAPIDAFDALADDVLVPDSAPNNDAATDSASDAATDSSHPPSGIDWTTHRLVPNHDFEDGALGAPVRWTVAASAPSSARVVAPGRTGGQALRLVDGSSTEAVSALSETLAAIPGETITVTAWAHRIGGMAGTLYLEFREPDGTRTTVNASQTRDIGAVATWQSVSVSGVVPATAVTATVRIYSKQADTGTTDWDDVTVTSTPPGGYAAPVGTGVVLFVGDHRIESYDGLVRTMHPGTKVSAPALQSAGAGIVLRGTAGTWNANARQGTVIANADGSGFRMWYTGASSTGYAESVDGITWDTALAPSPTFSEEIGGVVENPAATGPRYFTLYSDSRDNPNPGTRHYRAASSIDGRTWQSFASPGIPGWDVMNVSFDPSRRRFVAMVKDWSTTPVTTPRRVNLSTSTDFVTWSAPRLVLSADARDLDIAHARFPSVSPAPGVEIYGMPSMRYGEQYLGLPWVFEILQTGASVGQDEGPVLTQLAASQDLVHWNRPDRTPIVTPGAASTAWDHGQIYSGSSFVTVGDEVRLYYGGWLGYHAQGGGARVGLATWPRDRFVSWHATTAGSVTTRTLDAAGSVLAVNVDPNGGELRVEVLDADGHAIPGYTLAESIPINAASLHQQVGWTSHSSLPVDRPLRLRFALTAGDLYAYQIE